MQTVISVIKQEIRSSSRGLESLTSVLEEEVSYCTIAQDRATFESSRCDKPFSSKTEILVPTKKHPAYALRLLHLGASWCYQILWLTSLLGPSFPHFQRWAKLLHGHYISNLTDFIFIWKGEEFGLFRTARIKYKTDLINEFFFLV